MVTPLDDNHQLGLQISDGNAVTLDLSALNTDEQTLTTAFENNTLTTSISNGNSVSADLSALDNSSLTTTFENNTLHTIEQEKKINAQEKEIKSLKSALDTLLERMAALENKQP